MTFYVEIEADLFTGQKKTSWDDYDVDEKSAGETGFKADHETGGKTECKSDIKAKYVEFDMEIVTEQVINAVLDEEDCPYEVQINLLITDNEGIRTCNREHRGIDAATDVLSFPCLSFRQAADFEIAEEEWDSCFDPDSGELLLGDIMISAEMVRSQAAEYGHSLKREFAFLLAHSMLHLCGYDHMLPEEMALMEEKQEAILTGLGITRQENIL